MPLERRGGSLGTLRARLVYQSRKLSTLESDLLLAIFARDNLKITEEKLKEYDKLLDEPDRNIFHWATGKRMSPERWTTSALLEKLRLHAKNEGKVVHRMPPLSGRYSLVIECTLTDEKSSNIFKERYQLIAIVR
ncbi:DUF339-domain-containing protein [Gymnopus androsaceus JB14]|uniref:DUF339-domain-containing protein n=1 Tax=Gymnopus androsaceus JB14 TaxID=1447944 RepID=A0A6A4GSY7_9AGAR|nr:DUF339-domain-containing protein [Gymnopus androsaceus JB14]